MKRAFRLTPLLCLLLLALCAGCGKRTYPIKGKIVFADSKQPATQLKDYLITFESVDEPVSATAPIRDDASFEMTTFAPGDGAISGQHRVAITAPMPLGDSPRIRSLIAERYGALETSGLTIDVNAARDDVVFEVERAGKE